MKLTLTFENKEGKTLILVTSNLDEDFTHYYIYQDIITPDKTAMLYSSLSVKELVKVLSDKYPTVNRRGEAYLEESQILKDSGVYLV